MIEHLVVLLEEPSAEDFLREIIRKVVPKTVCVHFLVFEGKQDLEKQLPRRVRGWLQPNSRFFVMRDQDSGDCRQIKNRLVDLCVQAGRADAVVRIACRELESFFLGDLEAVAKAFNRPQIARHRHTAKYRNPDLLGSPVDELRKLVPGYQKREGARRISPFLNLEVNQSRSFIAVMAGLNKALNRPPDRPRRPDVT